tara:strand:+ start:795 stop:1262 length:468 start_codon:yes stop_codon:yes gene_type:complete
VTDLPQRFVLTLAALALLGAPALPPAHAEATAPSPKRGTEGLVAVPLEVTNAGDLTLSCEAKLAHWYSFALGTAAYGVTLSATLWSDPSSGAVVLLNRIGDQMPVERIWCGVEGRSWDTRFEMPLARAAGTAEAPLRFSCVSGAKDAAPITCSAP